MGTEVTLSVKSLSLIHICYEYTVTLDNETLIADAEGKYTIPSSKINGTAFTVTVEKTEKSKIQVEVSQYIVLNGKTMWLVKASGTVSEGKILAYDSNPIDVYKRQVYDN